MIFWQMEVNHYFLDYIASSKSKNDEFLQLITSINKACKDAGCSLVGGETAEMRGMYKKMILTLQDSQLEL